MLRCGRADAGSVTWVTPRHVLLAGVLAGVLVGLAVLWSTFHVPVDRPWGWLYSAKEWNAVQRTFARRGFEADSVDVVTAIPLANGQQFAMISARSSDGRTCLAVARGTSLGATICHVSKPLLVFYARDTCAACAPSGPPLETRSILGLARGDVTVTIVSQGREGGMAPISTPIGFAFQGGFIHSGDRLRARDARGRVLASVSADQ
jgi:hypothetical protein